jgi:hypothetical protein
MTIRKLKYIKIKAHKVIVSGNNLFIWISSKCQQHSQLLLEKIGVGHSVLEAEGIENMKSENTCFNSMGVGILNLYLF